MYGEGKLAEKWQRGQLLGGNKINKTAVQSALWRVGGVREEGEGLQTAMGSFINLPGLIKGTQLHIQHLHPPAYWFSSECWFSDPLFNLH